MLLVVRRWTPALALVALAGLFAMHGIGDHAATHAALPGTPAHAGHALGTMDVPSWAEGNGVTAADEPATAAAAVDPVAPLGDSGVMALCFAVLVGGALALALLALRGRTDLAWRRTAWPAGRLPRSRDPDPPRPLLLGVCRC